MTKQKETTWSHTKALLPQIQEAYTAMCRNALSGGEISLKKFTLLLSGISACRKTPGIPEHMGYEPVSYTHLFAGIVHGLNPTPTLRV